MIPVTEVEAVVAPIRSRWDSNAPRGVPAHVTVLYPFVPPDRIDDTVLDAVRDVLAAHARFAFRLVDVRRFPGPTVYLAPEPAAPFRALTRGLHARWPECPPYGGQFADPVPHLTVADTDGAPADEIATALAPALPITATARDVLVMIEDKHEDWHVLATLPLGGAAG